MLITEDFLHYVWKFRLFDFGTLVTTAGQSIEIESAGISHIDSGPDFQNVRIKIDDTVWAGNVEVHISSSDWRRHGHQTDNAYQNVILHVVYTDDVPLIMPDGRRVPTLELKSRIPELLYSRYNQLIYSRQQFIPCQETIGKVDGLTLHNWLTRVMVERLEKRLAGVINALNLANGDWEETFYRFMAANFGFKINALPFELLARSLPQNILARHKNNSLQIEALVFGQAGFLEDDALDDYSRKLKEEYNFLRKKYALTPVEKHLWKFLRLRPQNFPTIRLAQFAALIINSNHLFSKVLNVTEPQALRALFSGLQINEYWQTHYRFGVESKPAVKNMGADAVNNLLLNTVVLFLFSYGRHQQLPHYVSRSLKLLESLPAEHNNIINEFVNFGVNINNAFETQALLELRNNYCTFKKCLQCGIGNKILKLA